MIDVVEDMLVKHSDAEIIEYLYDKVSEVARTYKLTSDNKLPAEYIWAATHNVYEARDILKALHKRNQARQAQADMV